MSSLATACRLSARLTARQLRQDSTARGFRTSAACLAAQNFTMPALSPTMTEGSIASWKVKEGDSFVAGDVLLEIETDKASMDVEAQDDGIMAKITQGDGSKGVKVGARIGVLADTGDDLSTLEITPEEKEAEAPPPKELKETKVTKPVQETSASTDKPSKNVPLAPKGKKRSFPSTPAVASLISANGMAASDVEGIKPSGPQGRILKGDVLAYLKTISEKSAKDMATKYDKRSTLTEFVTQGAYAPSDKKDDATPPPKAVVEDLEVAVPISMKAVLEVQKRIESTLGVFMPLSTFIARATDVANDGLPRPKSYQPSADELFNDILGINKVVPANGIRGSFLPQIGALPETSFSKPSKPARNVDIIDMLSGKGLSSRVARSKSKPGLSTSVNIFSLKVPKGDEKTAKIFLERVKTVLEVEPGRLAL
ncbi:pyruvate dehydrogenase protein-like protein x component [Calycina marina]|uniref:Pyruvate dehydrogenase protein-like protein x component n=1 Tax=Calycina marina TaxID=1763456 RepID=A0A9P7Z1E9_9HELO|nr:pyruvate dehydrogenase protein-like protein x component [Calycina marina]